MMKTKTVADAKILSVLNNGEKLLVHVLDVDGTERDVYVMKEELIDYEGDADQEIVEKIMHDERFKPFLGLRLIVLLKCYYAKKQI